MAKHEDENINKDTLAVIQKFMKWVHILPQMVASRADITRVQSFGCDTWSMVLIAYGGKKVAAWH